MRKTKQKQRRRKFFPENPHPSGYVRFNSIYRYIQYFRNFFVFFTFHQIEQHHFPAFVRQGIDPFLNPGNQFFMLGIIRRKIYFFEFCLMLFMPGFHFEMIQIIDCPVAGKTKEIGLYGLRKIDFLTPGPHHQENIVHDIFSHFPVFHITHRVKTQGLEKFPERIFKLHPYITLFVMPAHNTLKDNFLTSTKIMDLKEIAKQKVVPPMCHFWAQKR